MAPQPFRDTMLPPDVCHEQNRPIKFPPHKPEYLVEVHDEKLLSAVVPSAKWNLKPIVGRSSQVVIAMTGFVMDTWFFEEPRAGDPSVRVTLDPPASGVNVISKPTIFDDLMAKEN